MKLGRLRTVLFDFDGTLADSYEAIAASVNHVRRSYGLAPLPVAEIRRHVGRGPAHLVAHTIPGADVHTATTRYRAHHPSVMRIGTSLLPGAVEALRAAKERQLKTAVCSNKPVAFTRDLLVFLEIANLVDLVLGPEDVPRPKPAPDMLRLALARLDVAPAEALYIGDMVVDIETARAAGVRIWIVPTGSDDRQILATARPDRIVDDLHELAILLREQAGEEMATSGGS